MATTTYEPIATQTLSSSTGTVTFSSIPQTYTDLVLVCNIKSGNTNQSALLYELNGNASGNLYSGTMIYGTGSAAGSNRQSSQNYGTIMRNNGLSTSSTVMQPFISHFMNYSNTTTYKTVLSRNNVSDAGLGADISLWRDTSAITSIRVYADTNAFASGSTFSLYGIANAAIGAPKAQGGIITYDSEYYYHTFGASGTFTPQQSLTADILVVAGGGGAGSGGSGGGAGGLLGFASQSLTATGYTVTVGSGGTGATSTSGANGSTGSDSRFGALTLVKGGGYGVGGNSTNGGAGGSGGGAYFFGSPGAATSGQGNTGGNSNGDGMPGGGGGAGAVGGDAVGATGGAGGGGVSTYSSYGLATGTGQNVSGTIYYAGGGAGGGGVNGGVPANGLGGAGGLGGGGNGGNPGSTPGTNGLVNTGGGGGSGGHNYGTNYSAPGGNGGSGVVIVRYLKA